MTVEQPENNGLALASDFPLYNPDNDFRRLALETAYVSEGFRLVDKEELIGVPFVVKRVVYREGFPRADALGDYASVECIVADKNTLESEPVRAQIPKLTVFPNEGVIFNDSGTGIRRTLTKLFHEHMLIDVGEAIGEYNKFDKPYQSWAEGYALAESGIRGEDFSKKAIYLALRGLRVSRYEWNKQDAETWYFA